MVIGVCDDEALWRKEEIASLERLSEELCEHFTFRIFESGEEVVEYKDDIDILLLDVELSGINGIETMRLVEDHDNVKSIVFVSGYEKYVFEAFGKKTKGFICKPIHYEDISREIKRIVYHQRKKRYIDVETHEGIKRIDVENIQYIYAESNYVRMYTKKEDYLLYGNLKSWEERLLDYDIIRVHKSYLVNLEEVFQLKNDVVMRKKEKIIPLGRKYRDNSRTKYRQFLFNKIREETML